MAVVKSSRLPRELDPRKEMPMINKRDREVLFSGSTCGGIYDLTNIINFAYLDLICCWRVGSDVNARTVLESCTYIELS